MEREITNFRRERSGSRFRFLLYILFLLFLPLFLSENAFAADKTPIANPAGTTIDFFDYYVYDKNGKPTVNYNNDGLGINQGHTLRFHTNTSNKQLWNYWSQRPGGVTQGIVKPFLTEDGFPELNCGGTVYQRDGSTLSDQQLTCVQGDSESLDYLFKVELPDDYDPADFDPQNPDFYRTIPFGDVDEEADDLYVWQAYPRINYLYTVDQNGYYSFDSQHDRAFIDRDHATVTVDNHVHTSIDRYGFYPFSDDENDPSRHGSRPNNSGDVRGFFFGVHIQSDFSIPYDYMVENQSGEYQDMVFNFTGDDDVWVYIDGILIGDAGGIHSMQDLSINFKTGVVSIINSDPRAAYHTEEPDTTIFLMVAKAFADTYYNGNMERGKARAKEEFEWNDQDNPTTFAGGTYHKLDFFYLERGAGGSNMKMQYNLVSSYDFTAHKSLHRGSDGGDAVLQNDQFRYRLTGFPSTYADPVTGENRLWEAIMPKKEHDKNVTWVTDYIPADKSLIEPEILQTPKTLIVGNSMDGFINFGGGDLKGSLAEAGSEFALYVDKTFEYVYEELPPADARIKCDGPFSWKGQMINPDPAGSCKYNFGGEIIDFAADPEKLPPAGARYQGTYTYHGADVAMNADGTYTFDGITYDNTVYYFKGTLVLEDCEEDEGSTNGEGDAGGEGDTASEGDSGDTCNEERQAWVQKTYYTDYTYETQSAPGYRAFNNRYDSVGQVDLNARKKLLSHEGDVLPTESQAYSFTLSSQTGSYSDTKYNAGDGSVDFDSIVYKISDLPEDEDEAYYMYEIVENPGTSEKIDYSTEKYYALVHVIDNQNGTMSVEKQYYRPCNAGECEGNDPETMICLNAGGQCLVGIDEKDVIFTNQENGSRQLTVDKTVGGNIGSRDKDFEYTLTMEEMGGKTVQFSKDGGQTFETLEFDEDKKASFSLRHGETITIYGIHGAYTLTETTDGGYTTTWHSSNDPETETIGKTAAGTVTLDSDESVSYTNTLEITPPTGIREEIGPALAGMAAAAVMLFMLLAGKKRENNG